MRLRLDPESSSNCNSNRRISDVLAVNPLIITEHALNSPDGLLSTGAQFGTSGAPDPAHLRQLRSQDALGCAA